MGFENPLTFLLEKLNKLWLAILHPFICLFNAVKIGFEEAINFPAEKLRELWSTMVHAWDPFVRWLQKVFRPEIWLDRFNYLVKCFQKLALDDTWYPFLTWFDRVFPPETRAERLYHWFQISLPFVAVAVVLALICYCCTHRPNFIFGVARWMKAACGCCCGYGRKVTMMIAPGTAGMVIMPRNVFEADPKGYFLRLRGRP